MNINDTFINANMVECEVNSNKTGINYIVFNTLDKLCYLTQKMYSCVNKENTPYFNFKVLCITT